MSNNAIAAFVQQVIENTTFTAFAAETATVTTFTATTATITTATITTANVTDLIATNSTLGVGTGTTLNLSGGLTIGAGIKPPITGTALTAGTVSAGNGVVIFDASAGSIGVPVSGAIPAGQTVIVVKGDTTSNQILVGSTSTIFAQGTTGGATGGLAITNGWGYVSLISRGTAGFIKGPSSL